MKIRVSHTLITLRKSHGKTQEQLAESLFVSRPTYSRYENNTLELTISQLFLLASVYSIKTIDLLFMIMKENRGEAASDQGSSLGGVELLALIKAQLDILSG